MRILLTGGTGFIGRALTRSLLADRHDVAVLTRRRADATARAPAGIAFVESFDQLPADWRPEAVVNLAGENLGAHRWSERRKKVFVQSRVGTTRRLVEWFRQLPERPRILVSGSAVGYYGDRGDEPLTEEAAPGDEFQSRLCRDWEAEAIRAEALGVHVCRIRIGVVLDRGGGALAAMERPFRMGLGGHLGHGRQWMSWIHRADLVALIRWLLARPGAQNVYNATAPEPVTNRDFARTFAAVLHRPALMPLPAFAVRLLVGEMAHLLLTGQRVLPRRALADGFQFRFPTLTEALADIVGR